MSAFEIAQFFARKRANVLQILFDFGAVRMQNTARVRAHFKRWALGPTLRPPLPPLQVGPGAMRAKKAAKSAANNYSKSTKFRQSLHEVCTMFVRN